MSKVEVMAPVGNFESLAAAIKSGADSVYFGVGKLNMRARAALNFTIDDLEKVVGICKENNVKSYLTVNTVLYDNDLDYMKSICDKAKEMGITAVIVTDMAAIEYARSIGLEVHMSTQTNISNIEAVKFFSKFADVVVLARELKLEQIKNIFYEIEKQDVRGPKGELVKIEIFVHGALCVAISGKCYMSLAQYNHSANRGDCLQACRRKYIVTDEETGDELKIENNYVMSPKDLCTINFIDKIIDSGTSVLKIEGRGRSADYVYSVVKCYKEAVESYFDGSYNEDKIAHWIRELKKVFNRGFWYGGYYLGEELGEWSGSYGSQAIHEKHFVGIVKHYFPKAGIGEFVLQKEEIKVGEEFLIIGSKTGVVKGKVKSIFVDDSDSSKAVKGENFTMPVGERVREGDKLYVLKEKG